jgi:hypothetical protein
VEKDHRCLVIPLGRGGDDLEGTPSLHSREREKERERGRETGERKSMRVRERLERRGGEEHSVWEGSPHMSHRTNRVGTCKRGNERCVCQDEQSGTAEAFNHEKSSGILSKIGS